MAATTVVDAAFVLWVGHVSAHTLSETLNEQRSPLECDRVVARRELGIVLAAVVPCATLALGAVGVFKESSAVWLALGVGLATLAAVGVRYARLEGLGRAGTVTALALNVALGLLVVAFKVLVAH